MKAQLKKLIEMAWQLEQKSADGHWPAAELHEFQKALQEFPDSRLSAWAYHLTPSMSLQHFQSLIVPLEREYQKNPSDEDFLISTTDTKDRQRQILPLHLALVHWRSGFNVGSLFRTADGLGVEHLHLLGYTPTPENAAVKKTALGSDDSVGWTQQAKPTEALQSLKAEGFHLVAFETSARAKPLSEKFPRSKTLMIFGNERFGLNPEELKLCDEIRSIPMQGIKNSLNVGVCAALAIYEWKKQWDMN